MKSLNKFFLVIFAIFLFTSSYGQNNISETNLNGLDPYIENAMKDWSVQGCAVAIVKNGKVIFSKGFGFRDVKNQLPVTPNTLFAIGSCTKAFTSASICLLVDEGKVVFNKPVIDYIPTFKLFDEYVTNHIIVKDILCHRSALSRHDLSWYGADELS